VEVVSCLFSQLDTVLGTWGSDKYKRITFQNSVQHMLFGKIESLAVALIKKKCSETEQSASIVVIYIYIYI
jgi:hypothetical protein